MNRKTNNTASSVIQTTEGRKNLGNTKWTLPRSFAPLWMTKGDVTEILRSALNDK